MRSLAFDIETGSLPEEQVLAQCKPFAPRTGTVNADVIERQREEWKTKILEESPLHAETGQVLAIGLYDGRDFEILEGEERDILNLFWFQASTMQRVGDRLVGHHCFTFDLPFLMRRSWILGAKIQPITLENGRWWNNTFQDINQVWSCGVYGEKISLDQLAKTLGVGEKTGSGADFQRLWLEDRPAALKYLHNDLALTYKIALAIGVVYPPF